MRGTPGQRLTSAFSLCVPGLLGGQHAVVTAAGREVGSHVCVYVWEKVCVSDLCSEVLTLIWDCRKLLYHSFAVHFTNNHVGCVWGVLSPASVVQISLLFWITCIILKSRKWAPLLEKDASAAPPPPRIMTSCFTLEIRAAICDLFINCDSVMNGLLKANIDWVKRNITWLKANVHKQLRLVVS